MKVKRTIWGIAINSNECLRPTKSASHPTTTVPMRPPIPKIAPIQAISDMETRPVGNGQSSEAKIKNADAIHPTEQP